MCGRRALLLTQNDIFAPMNSTPNPYQPPSVMIDNPSMLVRLRNWYRVPFPVRVGDERSFQWVADALITMLMWIGGCVIDNLCRQASPFPIPYSVGLTIGWFPIGMWFHYCRVAHFTRWRSILFISFMIAVDAGAVDFQGLRTLPLAYTVLAVVLSFEHLLGKLVLARLPASSTRR